MDGLVQNTDARENQSGVESAESNSHEQEIESSSEPDIVKVNLQVINQLDQ